MNFSKIKFCGKKLERKNRRPRSWVHASPDYLQALALYTKPAVRSWGGGEYHQHQQQQQQQPSGILEAEVPKPWVKVVLEEGCWTRLRVFAVGAINSVFVRNFAHEFQT